VLSGYLITTLLVEEWSLTGTISLANFYKRRARRLLPALVAVSAFSLVAFSLVRPYETDATLLGIGASLLYVSCWLRAYGVSLLGWFGHSWSLGVEEHFYLLWPPALLLICRKRSSHLKQWVLVVFAVSVAYFLVSVMLGASVHRQNNAPDLRAQQLMAGCALAVVLWDQSRRPRWWERCWPALVALSIVDLVRTVAFPQGFGAAWFNYRSTIIAIESAVIIGYLATHAGSRLTRLLSARSLVWTGRRSYAVYLWHLPMFGLFDLKGEPQAYRVAGRIAAVALTFVAAWASFKWVERPFYRRRVEERRSSAPEMRPG
jgi:peptidoglycan/LPS O-acetylase OafA/YrhL